MHYTNKNYRRVSNILWQSIIVIHQLVTELFEKSDVTPALKCIIGQFASRPNARGGFSHKEENLGDAGVY